LDDTEEGSITKLISQDGSIITYNFDQANLYNLTPNDFTNNLIPISNANIAWKIANAPTNVYQAHWIVKNVVGFYHSIGIDYEKINVGANCSNILAESERPNAAALNGSDLKEGFVVIGESNGSTLAEFDIIGHELGHIFLHEFLDYDEAGNASLQEGIADMLGVFIEMQQNNGVVDWDIGEDVPNIIRNLENPEFNCYDDVENLNFIYSHKRSTPLGHWFFIASTNGTPNIGILKTLDIVLEALNHIGRDSDYEELMEATLTIVEENFGRCSEEFAAINNAWETICVETGFGILNTHPCDYSISGPTWVCEENDYAKFCIQGGFPNAHYRWTIIGKKSTEYKSLCGMQGNSQEGCNCLTLIDFPKYPYYPQYITIKVYSPTVGSNFIVKKKVKLVDCNNDDPTCDEYYNLQVPPNENTINQFKNERSTLRRESVSPKQPIHDIIIYNLYGDIISRGLKSNQMNDINHLRNGIYIIIEIDEHGNLISLKKQAIIK